MARLVSRFAHVVLAIGIVSLGAYPYEAGAHSATHRAAAAHPQQADAVLLWQGKILPIITDVYATFGNLSTALQNRDLDGIAKTGDQFAGEQQRFEQVKPVPHATSHTARVMDQGLRDLTNGTKALVVGLRATDNTAAQRGAVQVENGLKLFQQAVDQIRRINGPIGEPTVMPGPGAGPQPTPIIRGLP